MYIDLLKAHYNTKNEEKMEIKYETEKTSRFSGIYKPEEGSSSSSDDESTFGYRKLSPRKSQKLLNYLLVEINSSR
jgi:hypothetical protein